MSFLLGLCHLALCFVGTIVYLVFYNTEDFECETSRNINDVIECILLGSMIGATIWVNMYSFYTEMVS